MKDPLLHALNIGTLALWLSVAGSAAVAIWVPVSTPQFVISNETETALYAEDFSLGETTDSPPDPASNDDPSASSAMAAATLPTPPALPAVAGFDALPEIPELPAAPEKSESSPGTPKPTARVSPAGKSSPPGSRTSAPAGTAPPGKPSAGSGMSVSARLAAGRMPRPSYPALSRRNNQTGTVVVQFTIGTDGNVTSATIYKSSNWLLLDREALRTVRTWRFPPGDVMTNIKPITFKLE